MIKDSDDEADEEEEREEERDYIQSVAEDKSPIYGNLCAELLLFPLNIPNPYR